MELHSKTVITVQVKINAAIATVWKYWSNPEDIVEWYTASDDWHTPQAKNDLKENGKFNFRMEAKDGSMGFDFEGVYDTVIAKKQIDFTLADGRKVSIIFISYNKKTEVIETFEVEDINPIKMQREGWQAILDNFKKYVEEKQK